MPPLRLLGRRALRSAGGEPLCSADSVRLCASVVHVPVRPWSPQSQGLPREADAAPVARHLADCMGKTDGAGGGGVSARVPELRRRYPADRVQTVLPVRNHPWPSHCWQPPREKAGGLRSAWCAPKRQEHATHEPLISRAMLAEVPLAGLSFRGRHCSLPRRARSRPSPHRGPAGRARVRPPPPRRAATAAASSFASARSRFIFQLPATILVRGMRNGSGGVSGGRQRIAAVIDVEARSDRAVPAGLSAAGRYPG
jgi:hypothetical protein